MEAVADNLRALGIDVSDLRFVGSLRGQESTLLATSDVALTLLPGADYVVRFALTPWSRIWAPSGRSAWRW